MKKVLISVLSITLAFSSCRMIGGERVRGDGSVKTEKRDLSEFKGVRLAGSMDVHLEIGTTYSVTVETDENILPYIETEVDGDQLKIDTRDNVSLRPSRSVQIHVTAPTYQRISLTGSGNIYAKSPIDAGEKMDINVSGSGNIEAVAKAESLSADISGSGEITLKGSAKRIKSRITGSGNLVAGDFEAEDGDFNLAGSGNAKARITNNLDVHIAGSGDVAYYGQPKVNSHIAGSGSVRRLD